ncbi:PAS domain S-box protein [Pararhizobium sp. PWRC1-1]|uniref:hybrid sensor histidine kinase/response regulator n=1 Tax=Pararhizobium sp. PWRC1-1 TaxID=2804566 RepID=UPI003CECE22C
MTANDNHQTSDGKYHLLVDAITDYAIYMLDPDGNVTSWNSGAQRLKGYTEQEIVGLHFSNFYTPEDRAVNLPARALATAAGEGRFENEGWRVRKDGTRFWAHVIIDPIRSPDGPLLGYAKITRDLSERKAAEAELRMSEHQFRTLVQGVGDYAIYLLDPGGHITNWNLGAQRIKGYWPDEIIGQHFSRFYTDEDLAENLPARALAEADRTGRFEREGWRVRKDGSRFWANVVIDAIHDDDGQLIGYAKITRDITEKKEAQRALEQAREELFQSQKMEVIGQLAGGMAHDFNNLLMAIMGSLELLKKRIPDSPGTARLFENAVAGAERGAALTQRVLAFSRKQELNVGAVDILDLVNGMVEMLQRTLGSPINVKTNFPAELPKVSSDPNQLVSAILNLSINARDAMPEGGTLVIGAVEKKIRRGDIGTLDAGGYLCLFVRDDGEGMNAETLAKATTPFFTTKGVGKGTGLGLSMVQGMVAQTGGHLNLVSSVGEGTTAELYLPLAIGIEDADTETKAPIELSTRSHSLKILAVDDDPLILMNTVLMLEDLGHEVKEATSAQAALDLFTSNGGFDLVVTDHSMPGMTGSDLARQLRQFQPDLPIVLASGYTDLPPGSVQELVRLTKPYTEDQLRNAIEEVSGNGRF